MCKLEGVKEYLIDQLYEHKEDGCTEELGAVIDMIKDIEMACYYKKLNDKNENNSVEITK